MRGLDLKAWLRPESKAITGQRLIYEGKDLDDLATLEEQGLGEGSIVYRIALLGFFTPRPVADETCPPLEHLTLRTIPNNQSLKMKVEPSQTVASLLEQIHSMFGHRKGTEYRIFYRGVALGEAPYLAISDLQGYGIPDDATLLLFVLKQPSYQE